MGCSLNTNEVDGTTSTSFWVITCEYKHARWYLRLMQSTQQIDNNMLYLLGCF